MLFVSPTARVRVGSRRVDAAWRSRFAHGACHPGGRVFINNYGAGGGVELPFGGVKSSGYGRERGFGSPVWVQRIEDRPVVRHG